MATCKDCLHYEPCYEYGNMLDPIHGGVKCDSFKNKADVVEVETIKAWLYEMAINNVGCVIDGDFSNACEEIIARLDGLKNFAKERSEG